MKKKLLTVALSAIMVVSSAIPSFASETLVGTGWWTGSPVSTGVSLEDGSTVAFNIDIAEGEAAGEYAAFCVEASDGTNYMTCASGGDLWGAGADTDGNIQEVATGESYTVFVSREVNDFTVTMVNNATNTIKTVSTLAGNVEFGATNVYVMSQVGTIDVTTYVPETLVGTGWWTGSPVSTGIALSDGETVVFNVDVAEGEAAGEYAAFCVEATDGVNYMTCASGGDLWGAGADTDGTIEEVVTGGSYTVAVNRSGNDFTVTMINNVTNTVKTISTLAGTAEFGETTVYIMSQVGTVTASYVASEIVLPEEDTTPGEDDTTTDVPVTGGDDTTTDVPVTGGDDTTTDVPTTGDDDTTTSDTTTSTTVAGTVTEEVVADVQEAAKVEGENVPADSELVVSNVDTTSDDYKAVVEIIENDHKDKKFVTLDLKLMKENATVQPNGKIKVTLPVVEELKDAKMIQVYRIEDGKKVDLGKVEVKDGKFTFETDHFSTYVFVEASAETTTTATTTTTTPNTGDATMVGLFLAIAAASAVVVLKKRTVEE